MCKRKLEKEERGRRGKAELFSSCSTTSAGFKCGSQPSPCPQLRIAHSLPTRTGRAPRCACCAVQGAAPLDMNPPKPLHADKGIPRKVVYAPACVTRIMGPARGDDQQGEHFFHFISR